MIPTSKPQAAKHVVQSAALASWINRAFKATDSRIRSEPFPSFFLLGVRNYYTDSFDPGGSGRGIYDDAIFVVGPETFVAFNANTDPSIFRKGIASLALGWHPYQPGKHGITRPGGGYPAFRPATRNEELPVTRDGIAAPWPGVAINIHRGGRNSTSSEGCQTIPPAQWDAFHALVTMELKKAGLKKFWYGLIEGPIV